MEKQVDKAVVTVDDKSPFSYEIPFKMVTIPVAEEDYEKITNLMRC